MLYTLSGLYQTSYARETNACGFHLHCGLTGTFNYKREICSDTAQILADTAMKFCPTTVMHIKCQVVSPAESVDAVRKTQGK